MSDSTNRYYNDGASGGMFTGSTAADYAAYQAGRATLPPASGGGFRLTGGNVTGLVIVLLSPLLYVLLAGVYPLAGLLTLLSFIVILELMSGIGGIVIYLVMLPWCFIAFMFGWAIEGYLEGSLLYRRLRHLARILIIGFMVHVLAFGFFSEFDPNTSFFERLTFLHIVIVMLGGVAGHFLSKKLDAGIQYRMESLLTRFRPVEWLQNKMRRHSKANQAMVAKLEERIRASVSKD